MDIEEDEIEPSEPAIIRRSSAIDQLLNKTFIPFSAIQVTLIGACFIFRKSIILADAHWITPLAILSFTLFIFYIIGKLADRDDPGLFGCSVVFIALAALIAPVSAPAIAYSAIFAYVFLVIAILSGRCSTLDITIPPVYFAICLSATHDSFRIKLYLSMLTVNMLTLLYRSNVIRVFGSIMGYVLIVYMSDYLDPYRLPFKHLLYAADRGGSDAPFGLSWKISILILIFAVCSIYRYGFGTKLSSNTFKLIHTLIINLALLATILLVFGSDARYFGYLWPLGFAGCCCLFYFWEDKQVLYLPPDRLPIIFLCKSQVVRLIKLGSKTMRRSGTGQTNSRLMVRMPVNFPIDMSCLALAGLGTLWLSSLDIVAVPAAGKFWAASIVSWVMLYAVFRMNTTFKYSVIWNFVAAGNLGLSFLCRLTSQGARDNFFLKFEPIFSKNEHISLSQILHWNNYDLPRQAVLIVLVIALFCANTRRAVKGELPWWRGFLRDRRDAVVIRTATKGIEEWGKEMPLIGAIFKTPWGVFAALRYLKEDAAPIEFRDIFMIIGFINAGFAVVTVVDTALNGLTYSNGINTYDPSIVWISYATAWTVTGIGVFIAGVWREERLFTTLLIAFVIAAVCFSIFGDSSFSEYSYGQGILCILAGGTLLFCGLLPRRRRRRRTDILPTKEPPASFPALQAASGAGFGGHDRIGDDAS